MQRSEAINQEKNRAQKAAQYAELRCASHKAAHVGFDIERLTSVYKQAS